MKRSGALAVGLVGLGLLSNVARAQVDRPRFVIILDNSSSMTGSLAGATTHGDGSETHPGCDFDGLSTSGWRYDDSKIFQAKAAIVDTIAAFGSAEFALAVYARTMLGQPCTSNGECAAIADGATCVDLPEDASSQKFCVRQAGDTYRECSGVGCSNCANPADGNDRIFEWRQLDCGTRQCTYSSTCPGAQVIVGFPLGGPNYHDLYRWIDGKEDLPPFSAGSNREIRAEAWTPIAGSLRSVRDWLRDGSRTDVGPGAGLLSSDPTFRDPRIACRSYHIILVTDGEETCSPDPNNDPARAAEEAFVAGIRVHVVGFGTGYVSSLNAMALAGSGGARPAYFASSRAALASSLGDIILSSIPVPRCNCDATCYDEAAAFPQKGKTCFAGKGRCRRQGVYACNAAGDGVMCAESADCGATPLVAGTPQDETCGSLPGCLAPRPEDCADEDCDGEIDEGLTCACAHKPELCNGLDDNCNGIVDDIASLACGLDVGECRPGATACVSDGAGGKVVECQGGVPPANELCDNKDNDCDGAIDGFAQTCYPAGTLGCGHDAGAWSCQGTCQTGLQVCKAGDWQPCVGAVIPVDEVACDGQDNDCDGQVDENNPLPDTRCYPAGAGGCDLDGGTCVGECRLGYRGCAINPVTGRGELGCVGAVAPRPELCNGKDDDCDGEIDEDFPTLGRPCNEGSCQGAGKLVCNALGTDLECTVSSIGPTPEVCDGLDNDCDGQTDEIDGKMPGVGEPCGSAVGECRPGISACVDGRIACSDVKPRPEICNGKDDDCNGSLDDGVVAPADGCNPAGVEPGTALLGECRAGRFVCKGEAGWTCAGGVGPSGEICDGKDNDCDGVIDDGADCGPVHRCVNGACVPLCRSDEQPCTADRYCKDGVCLLKACVVVPCPPGQVCDGEGNCIDPCAKVSCLPGATCENGMCHDCYSRGCPSGQICHQRRCESDPCRNLACESGQYCVAGQCVENCATVRCPLGQGCRRGACVPDPCLGKSCPLGQFCDPASATCQYKPCSGISCLAGQACVESTGKCEPNPCELVRCQTGDVCVVLPDGIADCQPPGGREAVVAKVKLTGRGGLACSVSPRDSSAAAPVAFGLLVGLTLALRRRRR